ncbi:AI-2E family transporter [Xenophilus sp. Marseille-Q4582]|uniref:AI-2E family transporter n=1 Tax=Xenophilus sp. Marseille-Q4582 TaxID=2866600 RepID=UPI001CE4751F|nr:AI-2E family transporter [Xenophilus sp. Marseille-Q4582]
MSTNDAPLPPAVPVPGGAGGPAAAMDAAPAADADATAAQVIREVEAQREATGVGDAAPADPPRVLLHMPVDVRSISLVVMAVLACVFALRWAAPLFIPLMGSLLLTYALAPAVDRLQQWHLPRWAAATVLLLGLAGGIGATAWTLSDNAAELVDSLPVAAQKLRQAVRERSGRTSTLDTVQQAAEHLERAAQDNSHASPPPRRGVQRVIVERPPFNVRDYLWVGTVGLMNAAGQFTLVLFLTFFALCAGDTFRRKLVKITGPSLQKKRITVHVLDDITQHIQRYLLVQIGTSALVGVGTGLAFWAIGLQNAAVWAIVAGITNLIPYVGSLIVLVAASLVAFLQFNDMGMAALVGGSSLLIHTGVGQLLVPWLTSRTSRMNPVAVFVGVIFWGWLWGVWGLLLGIPILMVIKAVCDRVDDLRPIGELLGE